MSNGGNILKKMMHGIWRWAKPYMESLIITCISIAIMAFFYALIIGHFWK